MTSFASPPSSVIVTAEVSSSPTVLALKLAGTRRLSTTAPRVLSVPSPDKSVRNSPLARPLAALVYSALPMTMAMSVLPTLRPATDAL